VTTRQPVHTQLGAGRPHPSFSEGWNSPVVSRLAFLADPQNPIRRGLARTCSRLFHGSPQLRLPHLSRVVKSRDILYILSLDILYR